MSHSLVPISSFSLKVGDAVITPKGTFLVLRHDDLHANGDLYHILWLESQHESTLWEGDDVYGPAIVFPA